MHRFISIPNKEYHFIKREDKGDYHSHRKIMVPLFLWKKSSLDYSHLTFCSVFHPQSCYEMFTHCGLSQGRWKTAFAFLWDCGGQGLAEEVKKVNGNVAKIVPQILCGLKSEYLRYFCEPQMMNLTVTGSLQLILPLTTTLRRSDCIFKTQSSKFPQDRRLQFRQPKTWGVGRQGKQRDPASSLRRDELSEKITVPPAINKLFCHLDGLWHLKSLFGGHFGSIYLNILYICLFI